MYFCSASLTCGKCRHGVSDLKDLLYTIFYLDSLIFYIKYLKSTVIPDESGQVLAKIGTGSPQSTNTKNIAKSTVISPQSTGRKSKSQNQSSKHKTYTKKSKNNFYNLLLCFLFFILALFSKSSAVTLPVILFLFDYYYGRKLSWVSIVEKILFFAFSIVFGVINIMSQKAAGAIVSNYTFNYADRFYMLCYSIMYYFYSLIFPSHLANLHPFP